MKATFITLLLALSLPLGLVAAGAAHAAHRCDSVAEVAELGAHPTAHEIAEHAEAVLKHSEAVAKAEGNKLTKIADKFGVTWTDSNRADGKFLLGCVRPV